MIDAREPLRNYKIPAVGNTIAEEFPRVGDAVTAIAADIESLLSAVAGRALLSHTHAIADVTGLQTALDSKHPNTWRPALDDLTDVNAPSPTAGQVLTRVGSQWQPANVTIDAAAIVSGTIDVARLPALSSQLPVVSSGLLADLTAPQQAEITLGRTVLTSDGKRWVYAVSGGNKTLSSSYYQIADISPEITDVVGLQTALDGKAALLHGHAIADVTGLQTALDARLPLAGGTMTGPLTISGAALTAGAAVVHRIGDTTFGADGGNVEINRQGTGDRNAYVDFHAHGTPGATDYAARIIRNPGVNGQLDFFNTGTGPIRFFPAANTLIELGNPGAGNAVLMRRQNGTDTGGGLLLEKSVSGNTLSGDVKIDTNGNRFRVFENGGSFRGFNVDLTTCSGVDLTTLLTSSGLGSAMAAIAHTAIGSFGFFADLTVSSFSPGTNVAGSSLRWTSVGTVSGAFSYIAGGTPSGTWRRHGQGQAYDGGVAGVSLYQRVA